MKKITAFAILAITLISCNKETKTITKVDPATGKTINVEVPVEKSEENTADKMAIRDSSGVYIQSFNLEVGKTYPLTTYQRDVQTVTSPTGESQSGTSESTDEMSFLVNGYDKGVYDITINLIGKRSSQTSGGKTMVVDTKQSAPKDDNMKMMWTINKALVGNKLKMKMQENGKILSITGFEPIYTKVAASSATFIKDAAAKADFLKSFKNSFGEKSMSEQFTKNLMLIPEKGVKLGEKWTHTENATPDGKVKLTTTYALKSVGDGKAVITVNGGIPYKSEKRTQEGITRSMSSELTQTGTVTLDQQSGWITNQNINVKTSQVETLSDGKQTKNMKSVSNSTVMVNPASK
ncbi:DUF6263 family protein [Chryseobacterium sp.]|uniref:DUF6263 family protein n=1 Tax=Chryseobacterium sp. TaxID=1871047 RepID=UPI0011C9B63C|nr:DUF6263 family protein [Chryseobacterium sp.]TXF79330.1 hypothetical protein FUA25_02790 [Chryseobacterium sp.]